MLIELRSLIDIIPSFFFFFFFFNDTATTEIYTLSLHDALPILDKQLVPLPPAGASEDDGCGEPTRTKGRAQVRSEEHTSELQSQSNLVCRLLLEKKKKKKNITNNESTQSRYK